jgi:hypothetical protein
VSGGKDAILNVLDVKMRAGLQRTSVVKMQHSTLQTAAVTTGLSYFYAGPNIFLYNQNDNLRLIKLLLNIMYF